MAASPTESSLDLPSNHNKGRGGYLQELGGEGPTRTAGLGLNMMINYFESGARATAARTPAEDE